MVMVVVVGTGSAGSNHLKILNNLSEINPVAIPKRNQRLAELRDQGFRVARNLADSTLESAKFCIVASDTGQHLEDSVEAIDRNMSVLCEKPIAANSKDAAFLVRYSEQKSVNLFVGCLLRFSKSLDLFKGMLGEIGPVQSVRIECQSYLPEWRPERDYTASYSARKSEGGVLNDLIHEIDYAGWIFGWPVELTAFLRNSGHLGIQSEESADIYWLTQHGCSVSIRLDYLSRISRRVMSAYGELGNLKWDGILNQVTLHVQGKAPEKFRCPQTREEMLWDQDQAFLLSITSESSTGKQNEKVVYI